MGRKKHPTAYPGVRYREDERRTFRGSPDLYYSIRYRRNSILTEEGLGWASEGWTAKKAAAVLTELNSAFATGQAGATLAERRALAEQRREQEAAAAADASRRDQTYRHLVETHYLPWADMHKLSAKHDRQRLTGHIFPRLGDLTPTEITPGHVEALRDEVMAMRSPATTRQCLALVRSTLNHLARLGLFDGRNPVTGVRMPRLDNARERFFSRDEFARFLDAAQDSPLLRDAAILAVNTGLRLGEIQRLAREDVDLAHRVLTVRDTGGKPGGKAPLNDEAMAVLTRLCDAGAARLFTPRRGEKCWFSHAFDDVARRIGLNDGITDRRHRLTFHSLRHTFASWLALAGTDLYRIQRLMRHKSLTMTQRYAHLIPSELQGDVARLCAPRPAPQDSSGD
jgi:integrase